MRNTSSGTFFAAVINPSELLNLQQLDNILIINQFVKRKKIPNPDYDKFAKSKKFQKEYIYVWEGSDGKQFSEDEIEAVRPNLEETLYQRLAPYAMMILGLFMLTVGLSMDSDYGIDGLFNTCGVLFIIWSVFDFRFRRRKITFKDN